MNQLRISSDGQDVAIVRLSHISALWSQYLRVLFELWSLLILLDHDWEAPLSVLNPKVVVEGVLESSLVLVQLKKSVRLHTVLLIHVSPELVLLRLILLSRWVDVPHFALELEAMTLGF